MAITTKLGSELITEQFTTWSTKFDRPVAAGEFIRQGMIVQMNAGFAQVGITELAVVAVGRARTDADNTGGANGDINVELDTGIFGPYINSGTTIAAANEGALCYVLDDNTVILTAGGARSVAGSIVEVTADGVFVAFNYPAAPLGVPEA